MSDTPDLGKIVNLIMQNPSLISEISALAKKDEEDGEISHQEEEDELNESQTPKEAKTPTSARVSKSERRSKLLLAMKPYLKEERARTLDTVMTIADMLDAVRSK